MRTADLRRTAVSYAFLAPALIVLGLFAFLPMAQGLWLSLYSQPLLASPHWVGLENFRMLLHDGDFLKSLLNSIEYLLVVPVIAALSLALALLVEPALPAMGLFRALFYVPVVTTTVVVGLTWKFIYNEHGLLNGALRAAGIIDHDIPWLTSTGLALYCIMAVTTWKGLGYYMVVFLAGLRSIPNQLIEAARIDGARPWQIIWHIKLPALLPTLQLVMIISSIAALQVFEEIYMMTQGGPLHSSSTVVFMIWGSAFDTREGRLDMGYASAMGVVLFLVLIGFTATALWVTRRAEERA
jgi:putative chitobiose transport system permease protein